MIPRIEINEAVRAWGLRHDVVEKDYVLGWLLAGIAADEGLQSQWVFKGGTCIKKCYLETYRFSEDLDFTLTPTASRDSNEIVQRVRAVCAWVNEASGIEFPPELTEFRSTPNPRGGFTLRGKVGYRGPLQPPTLPKIQFDLTTDEVIVRPPILRPVYHPYSDRPAQPAHVRCYPIEEVLAEKTRAMGERGRPRDLYDIIRLSRRGRQVLSLNPAVVRDILERKCVHRGVETPTLAALESSPNWADMESEWGNMLGHQLPSLPPLDTYRADLAVYFDWLVGAPVEELPPIAETEASDAAWQPPATVALPAEWGVATPVETIRFAGANRLLLELDYRPQTGRPGLRLVEPYSFRRSRQGHLLLYARNVDRPRISAYRLGRVTNVKVTTQPFKPIWRVEF